MTMTNIILAHHAGARLLQQATGRYPSPEELACFVSGGGDMEYFQARGDVVVAQAVLDSPEELELDLGRLYQQLRQTQEKKGLGQVFTPVHAVEAALNLVGVGEAERVIVPACGGGEFLLSTARRWPGANIVGVDIDALALAVARSRLTLAGIQGVRLLQGNALILPMGRDYDLVLGNPPWGGKLDAGQVETYTISPGKLLNSFVYFIELAARLLRPGGRMALVLPEAFIKVWGYQGAREWFMQNFALSGLHYLPHLFRDYYAPAIIMAAVRRPAVAPQEIPVWIQRGRGKTHHYNTLPAQAVQPQRININWRRGMEAVWSKCAQGAVYLREGNVGAPLPPGQAVVDFSLGVVTGDNDRFVDDKPLSSLHVPVLRARDVRPFCVGQPSSWLKFKAGELKQAPPLAKYRVPAKIVYRFIAREIMAAPDYSGAPTLNNLNIIIPLRLPFSLEYLLALLNSKLINTLYMYRFFTGKVLTRHLKQLPLQVGREEEQQKITSLVRDLVAGQGDGGLLDEVIFSLYGLGEEERNLIAQQHRRLRGVFFV